MEVGIGTVDFNARSPGTFLSSGYYGKKKKATKKGGKKGTKKTTKKGIPKKG
jgi:hypothetical protein